MAWRRLVSPLLHSSLYQSPSKISQYNPSLSTPSPFGYLVRDRTQGGRMFNTASPISANQKVSALLGRIPFAVRYKPTVATYLGGLGKRSISTAQAFNVPSVRNRIKVIDVLAPHQTGGKNGLFGGAGTGKAYYSAQPGGGKSGGFRKQRKGRMKGLSCRGNRVNFGKYGLQALECAWITAKQIEAGRRAMSRNARGGGKIWVRVISDKPVTAKPTEVRMGKGKGAVSHMVAVVKPGRIIYEVGGVAENVARRAITIAGSKMPIKTKFVVSS